jgi:hypothetical protein
MTRIRALLVCGCLALTLTGAAQSGLDVGVTEDAGKADGGASFFAVLAGAGLTVNRVSIPWSPKDPMGLDLKTELDLWMPQAQLAGTRIVFAVAPQNARDLTASPSAKTEFVAFVRKLAETYPAVKDYVIGNEPNQPRFWLPQFTPTGKPLSAASYMPVLAKSYDALKAVDPTINVIGVGLSPRGNDRPAARNNVSRSPIRFLRDLGLAYRASKRKKPLMDELAFHPYPARNEDAPGVGYAWPNAGLPNLDRVKQAVWDAFNGTRQPTVAERGNRSAKPLKLDLDEVGWQVEIAPELVPMYHGVETNGTVDEDTQARYYSQIINMAACDPSVRMLSFFHLMDEYDLDRWQSGLVRADGTHRPAYEAVKQTLAATHGECPGTLKSWRHVTKVVKPYVRWGNLRKIRRASNKRWSLVAGAGEEAKFRVGIFKAGSKKAALTRAITRGRPKALLGATGMIKAKKRVVYLPSRKLKPGRYVYVIRMVSTMNPKRSSVFFSTPFRVSPARG